MPTTATPRATKTPKTKDTIRNHGLRLSPIAQDHWYLGSSLASQTFGGEDINLSGDWSSWKARDEAQSLPFVFDTMACAVFGTLKAWIMLARFHGFTDFPLDLSERYSGVMCGVTPSGSDPHKNAEIIRKTAGAVPQAVMPWTPDLDTWNEFYDRAMARSLLPFGKKLLDRFELGHEWVFPFNSDLTPKEKQQLLKEALKRGTVCVSVLAWRHKGDLYTKRDGEHDNHWVPALRFGGKKGTNLVIHDQYADPYVKTLTEDYNHDAAKMYFLKRKAEGSRNFWSVVWDSFANLLRS